ncbi:hypothetical protein [Alkalispirochaeta alkalica]|uniref:hypothetical protein n=1 Tax=Alkalispirochaeta alkalica TaxID=46356 RepID=UPI0003696B49|nr:hypothetical protein [Alkalispirochaeta alkalica]
MSNTAEYLEMAREVADELRENGKAATIVRPGSAGGWEKKFDALTGTWYWEDSEGTIVHDDPAQATKIPCFVLENRFAITHIDGSLVQARDRLFLASGHPVPGDELHTDGAVLKVVQAIPFRPAEVTIYTEVQAR